MAITAVSHEERAGLPAAAPDVSVVVPTCRRDAMLRRLLEALAGQDLPAGRFEVIVVDDACSATTPAIVGEAAERFPDVPFRLLPGPGRGPASARNVGWRAARGGVIAFIDDDAYPLDAAWLREGLASLADPDVAAVTGAVRVPIGEPPTDFQRNVRRLEDAPFLTCNAFCRRATLERLDGFDERFTAPYREDSDLQFRIEAAGGGIVRNPRAVVVHPAPPGSFAVSLRLQRYSAFNALIYRKHPRRYREILEKRAPLHYYAMLALLLAGAAAYLCRHRGWTAVCLAGWLWLDGRFFLHRQRGTTARPAHVLDLMLTSVLIPPLSVYWRLWGALRWRVWFF